MRLELCVQMHDLSTIDECLVAVDTGVRSKESKEEWRRIG